MEEITKTLIQLIVFYFFAAQFMYAFAASNIGALIAVAGAEFLKSLALPPPNHHFRHYRLRRFAQPADYFGFRQMVYFGTYFRTDAHVGRYCPWC